jgi:hypothetical protein
MTKKAKKAPKSRNHNGVRPPPKRFKKAAKKVAKKKK